MLLTLSSPILLHQDVKLSWIHWRNFDTPHPAILLVVNEINDGAPNSINYCYQNFDYKKADYELVNSELNKIDWQSLLEPLSSDTETMVETFYNTVFEVGERTVPKKILKPKSNSFPHWFSTELINVIIQKRGHINNIRHSSKSMIMIS